MENLTWDAFSTYLFVDRKQSTSRGSVNATRSRFRILQNWFGSRLFSRDNFNIFIQMLREKQYSVNYINNYIKLGKHIDRVLHSDAISDYTYFKKPKYKYIEVLTPDEIKQIAEVHMGYYRNATDINCRYRCLYWFLGTTGCRIQEALGLSWGDVFEDYVIFRETKNGDERIVPITDKVKGLFTILPQYTERVFQIRDTSEVNSDLKKRTAQLGITKRVYCHLFRHSFISECQKAKVPLTYIMKITGHKSIESVPTYSHAMMSELIAMLSSHPLWQEEQTMEYLAKQYREYTHQLVNKRLYEPKIIESDEYVQITIHKK